jgi:hypothetical protein
MPIEDENYGKVKKFIPKSKIKCSRCGDIIQSKYSGHFKTCTCFSNDGSGGCFIDETEHYCRFGGKFLHQDENGHWIDYETLINQKKKEDIWENTH